jgi:hypothetical protein
MPAKSDREGLPNSPGRQLLKKVGRVGGVVTHRLVPCRRMDGAYAQFTPDGRQASDGTTTWQGWPVPTPRSHLVC